eukprot:gene14779-16949_t
MLSANLTSRLDFDCYVQVVANYVLAFDLAMQQDFDVIVLPPAEKIDEFSTADFLNMITSARDSYTAIIHTVDHECVSHVPGQTVRSNKTGGYLVDDLIAAITSAHNRKTSSVERDRKRSRQGDQTDVAAQDQAHPSYNKLARTLQSNTHQSSYSPSHADLRCADEIAYWQYCQWQWQLYHQSQGQLQVDPGFPPHPRQALSRASTASNHHYHYQDHRDPNPHPSHSHPFPSTHPVPLMHPLHPTHTHLHPLQPSLTVHNPARDHRNSSCSSVTTEEKSSTSSRDLVPTITTTTHNVLARAERSDTDCSSS